MVVETVVLLALFKADLVAAVLVAVVVDEACAVLCLVLSTPNLVSS